MSSSRSLATKVKSRMMSTTEEECAQVYTAIKRWNAHDGAVLVPVVRKSTMAPLKEKTRPKWWKMKKSAKSTLCITTPDNLQREIDATASDGPVPELFLLISRHVDLPTLQFDVPATITNLYIIRCAPFSSPALSSSSSSSSLSTNDETPNLTNTTTLLLNGSSTFCATRLDKWQSSPAPSHNLILGPDVLIQLSSTSGNITIPWTVINKNLNLTNANKAALRKDVADHLRTLCEARYQDHTAWNTTWRAPINALLDIASGGGALTSVVACFANGVVVQAAAEHALDGMVRVAAGLMCVPTVGVGVGLTAAVAVYFVPWETVWAWFRSAFGAVMRWLVQAWENLKVWVKKAATTGGGQGAKLAVEMRVKPMLMAG